MWQEIIVYIILGIIGCYLAYLFFFRMKTSLRKKNGTACADCPADCVLRNLDVLRGDAAKDAYEIDEKLNEIGGD